jgi:YesN/AraC family two-component response regulator
VDQNTNPIINSAAILRVLIADDLQETRRNTRLMLSMIPSVKVIAIARDGKEAVELAVKAKPDIVVLDINMPEMNGLEAYAEIQKPHPETACIIISAEKDAQTFRTAISVGVQEYLTKPFTLDDLEAAIEKVSVNILSKRKNEIEAEKIRAEREIYLKQLAEEYARTRRTDDQAMQVYEHLAANPKCELRWLRILAMIYVVRQKWGKLRVLATRLALQVEKAKNQPR